MQELTEISKVLAGMPLWGLIAFIVLAGFGLAAYAIHAVLTLAKRRDE